MQKFGLEEFGRLLGKLETTGFSVSEKSYAPDLKIPRHVHDNIVMSFTLNGSFIEANSSSQYTCDQFGLSINPAGETHASRYAGKEPRCLIIEIKPSCLRLLPESVNALARPLYVQGATSSTLALRVHQELKSVDEVSALVVEGLLLELIGHIIRDNVKTGADKPPQWLLQARDYLHANFSEQISLQQIGQVVGAHPSHLSRMFRRYYHCAIGEYVRKLRLEQSVRDLKDTERPLAEIAAEAGFYDQSHFANAFKRHTGMTPAAFRRSQSRSSRTITLQSSKTIPPARS